MSVPIGSWPPDSQRNMGSERHAASEERALASVIYLLWPLALPVLFDTGEVQRSAWLKKHAQQAVVLGLSSWMLLFAVISVPFLLIVGGVVSYEATIQLYAISFLLDFCIMGIGVFLTLLCARRARRGEDFVLRSLLPIRKEQR